MVSPQIKIDPTVQGQLGARSQSLCSLGRTMFTPVSFPRRCAVNMFVQQIVFGGQAALILVLELRKFVCTRVVNKYLTVILAQNRCCGVYLECVCVCVFISGEECV